MLKVRNNLTGQIEDVPESQIPELVARGSHSLPKNIKIPVISPDGQPGTIDSSEAYTAFQSGFQYETREQTQERQNEEKFGNRPVSALAAGAARTMTFGVSDQALVQSEAADAKTLNEIKERNSEANLIGEGAGIILPTLATSGLGLAGGAVRGASAAGAAVEGLTAKALAKTLLRQGEASLAKKVLAQGVSKGAGSAVEGAFYGAGHIISEDALGNADLNAESLMANMGAGALIGGLAGGALGGGGVATKAAIDKGVQVAKPATSFFKRIIGSGDNVTEEATILGNLAGKKKDIAGLRQAADELEVTLTTGAESNNQITRTAESILNESPTVWGEQVKRQHEKVRAGVQGKAEKILAEAAEKTEQEIGDQVKQAIIKDVKAKYDPFNKAYEEIRRSRPNIDLDPKMSIRTGNNIGRLNIGAKGGDVEQYVQKKAIQLGAQKTVDDLANFVSEVKSDGRQYARMGNDRMAFATREVARLSERLHDRTILKTAISMAKSGAPQAELAAKELINGIRETNRNYAGFMQFISQFGKAAKMGKGTGFRQLVDRMEEIAPEQLARKLFNMKDSKSIEFMKKSFPAQFEELRKLEIAKVASRVAKEDPVHGASVDINKLVKEYYKLSPENRIMLFGKDGSRTIENIEKVHIAMPGISNPSRTDIRADFTRILTPVLNLRDMALAGLLKMADSGSREAYVVKGVQSLAQVEKSQKTIGKTISNAIEKFLSVADDKGARLKKATPAVATNALMDVSWTRKKPKDENVQKAYERHTKEIAAMVANPEGTVTNIMDNTAGLQQMAPKTQLALQVKLQKAVQFLHGKMPFNPAASRSSNLMIREWKPSTVEMRKFERYMRAVNKPMEVIKDFERGAMNREGIETLKEVYPEIYTQMVMQITERVTEMRVNLPYNKRLQLGNLLDIPVDLAQEPAYFAALQENFAPPQEPAESGAVKPTAKGVSSIDMAGQTETETQRITNRT